MRYTELLVEYDRSKTAQSIGQKLIDAALKDRSLINELIAMFPQGSTAMEVAKSDPAGFVNLALEHLEEADPSPTKQYSQWIARTYAKGGFKFEDLVNQLGPLLTKFARCSMKKSIKAQYNNIPWDVNQYKDFGTFMDTAEKLPDPDAVPAAPITSEDAGEFKNLTPPGCPWTIVQIIDEKAAGYFGLYKQPNETRWCTRRAGESGNMFGYYNKQGPLFVIIPNPPEHTGERYQFHFETKQYMNEKDHGIGMDGIEKLVKRCPQLTIALQPWAEKFTIAPLLTNDYKKLVKDFMPVARDNTAKLVAQYEDRIAAFGIKSMGEYGVQLPPGVAEQLTPEIKNYIRTAMDTLNQPGGFWERVVATIGSERNEDKIEALLSTDPQLTELTDRGQVAQKVTAAIASQFKNKTQISHILDLLLRDPLVRFIMRQVPKMYTTMLQEAGHALL